MTWKIYTRPARHTRRHRIRGEEYDGSRWKLHKSYKREKDARRALDNLLGKEPDHEWKNRQYKLVEIDHVQNEQSCDQA
jgi:hypothetical protein